jgi:putative endonuclease
MATHNELGKAGETVACAHLTAKGYEILHTNWRNGYCELDIIAKTAEELVFVEVKTRSAGSLANPQDAITNAKTRNIIAAADRFIHSCGIDLPARFDVISVTGKNPHFEIEHIEDAFYPPVNTYC